MQSYNKKLEIFLATTFTQNHTKKANVSINVPLIRVISYLRVSTTKQDQKDKSGFDRQEEITKAWLARPQNSDCYLDKKIRHTGSGAKSGRFDEFIRNLENGKYEKGTILLVESIDRFSREVIDDTLWTFQRFIRAGGVFACWDINDGARINSLGASNGNIYQIIGAMQNARTYWERRQKWKVGSLVKQQKNLENGYLGNFKVREEGQIDKLYPYWLSFNPNLTPPKGFSGGWLDIDKQAVNFIREIFYLARDMGA